MVIVIKADLGALVVVLIGLLSQTKNYYIAGLIPLFPTFALIAPSTVASDRCIEPFRTPTVFRMWSIFPFFLYLATLWFFTGLCPTPV
ncbi:GlpM family protein, partial [Salmonella enterica]|uniref:GlpM family protein n=1 Tax=Salmonella enterica TaxID=28901 RepID=UPI00398C33D9